MNEKMNEWRRAVEGTEQPLRVGPRPQQCVCVSVPTRSGRRKHFLHEATEQTDFGWSCLVTASSKGPDEAAKVLGEQGVWVSNPSLLIQLPVNSEAKLAKTTLQRKAKKKRRFKLHKMD